MSHAPLRPATSLLRRIAPLAVVLILAAPAAAQPGGGLETYVRVDAWPEPGDAGTSGVLRDPVGLDVAADGRAYVADAGVGGVHIVEPGGPWRDPFGADGQGPERLGGVGDLVVDQEAERVYVLDPGDQRVVIYDLDGNHVAAWDDLDGAAIGVYTPDGSGADPGATWVAVAERETNTVQLFDGNGTARYAFGGAGTSDGQFSLTRSVSFGPDGDVLAVADLDGLRVQVFDIGSTEANLRHVYSLNHPRYDIPRLGYPIHRQCRAGIVHALGGNDVWVGDGTGACRLTPERHEYTIASTIAQGNICKLSVRLPVVLDTSSQYFAIADIDRNAGSCYDGRPRSGKDTRLPITPALVQFSDPLLKRASTITLATTDDRQDSGLIVPQHISVPAPDNVFVQDTTRYVRRFAPDGTPLATTALSSREGAGATIRYEIERADGAGANTDEIFGYYRKLTSGREVEHGIGRFTSVERREFDDVVQAIEPVWTVNFSLMSPERANTRLNPIDSIEVIDVAYSHAADQMAALVFERMPKERQDDARIVWFRSDGVRRTEVWDLPEDETTTARMNPYVDISIGPDGAAYVLDDQFDRAYRFAPDGSSLPPIDLSPDVRAIAGGPDGVMFALRESGIVERHARDGTVTARFDGRPEATADPATLTAIAADGEGRVYTADGQSGRIGVFVVGAAGDPDAIPVPADATCEIFGDKSATPEQITLGDATTVSLALSGACGIGEPASDIVILTLFHPRPHHQLRLNGPDDPATPLIRELRRLVSRIDTNLHRVAIVGYWSHPELVLPLTHDPESLREAVQDIPRLMPNPPNCRGSEFFVRCLIVPRLREGIQASHEHLTDSSGSDRRRLILLYQPDYCNRELAYSDAQCRGYVPAEEAAAAAREDGIQLVVFDGNRTGYRRFRFNGTPYQNDAQPLASSDADVVLEYGEAQRRMVDYRVPEHIATDVRITDTLGTDVRLVGGSVAPPATVNGNRLTWDLAAISGPIIFSLDVRPSRTGLVPTNQRAEATFTDGWGRPGSVVFPVPEVEVVAPTITPTTTPGPTSTTEPTPVPRPIYLPVALRETPCVPTQQRIDVVLAIDVSSSMEETTAAGRTKLVAARSGAITFIDLLSLDEGDQASVVAFDADATVVQELTDDSDAVLSALDGLRTGAQTCLPCAVETAAAELDSERRRAGNTPVLVLLTDGRSNPRPASEAIPPATAAKERGVVIFTIGLGDELDEDVLSAIASGPEFDKRAADAEALAEIYSSIAISVPCPDDFWPTP